MTVERTEIFQRVKEILVNYLRLKPDEVTPQSHVVRELGADSLAMVELGFKFMESFGIGMIAPDDELLILDHLVDHIAEKMASRTNP